MEFFLLAWPKKYTHILRASSVSLNSQMIPSKTHYGLHTMYFPIKLEFRKKRIIDSGDRGSTGVGPSRVVKEGEEERPAAKWPPCSFRFQISCNFPEIFPEMVYFLILRLPPYNQCEAALEKKDGGKPTAIPDISHDRPLFESLNV